MESFRTTLLLGGLMMLLPPAHGREQPADEGPARLEAAVRADRLAVLDRPSGSGFICAQLRRGDRVTILVEQTPGIGWLAVAPPSTAILWIEESALELEPPASPGATSTRAWVRGAPAPLRSGHPGGKLPGPPRGHLRPGTRVELADCPPFVPGGAGRWLAIVPPPELAFYVQADGVESTGPQPLKRPPVAEMRASYEEPIARNEGRPKDPAAAWPPDVRSELNRLDGEYRVILSSQPIEKWHFETVRAGYQRLLKQSANQAGLEDALRDRLARLTRHEQAARSARTIEEILARSHRRDHEVAVLRRDLAQTGQSRGRAYDAIGFIQPSARRSDGHKLFALIGREGSAIAYLDVPPGLDPTPYLARRVGVRGQAHFDADLGTRLITVRDLESIETR